MIKVYLEYLRKPDSSYYKSLVNYPPQGIEYTNINKENFNIITSSQKFKLINLTKKGVRTAAKLLNLQRPNIKHTKEGNYDIIHGTRILSSNKKLWVVDIEKYWSLARFGGARTPRIKKIISKYLKSKYCKRILPWSAACKNEINEELRDPEINMKMEVLHYAIPLNKKEKIKHDNLKLLFASRYFYEKGGINTAEAFSRLKRKFDIDCLMIADVPSFIKKKYPDIEYKNLVSQQELFENYLSSDIFIYPSPIDTYGFIIPEVQSFGLPIIALNGFARRELIGKAGVVMPRPNIINLMEPNEEIINNIVNEATRLINNKELREKMGKAGQREVDEGKFSVKHRNYQLNKIYSEALE